MNIPLDKILSARGEAISNSAVYHAYKDYAAGLHVEARERLINIHVDSYYTVKSAKTREEALGIYERRGIEAPDYAEDIDPDILREAVSGRVDEYIERFEKLMRCGYGECSFIIYVKNFGEFFMLDSCGFNKCAAMLALGYEEVPNVIVAKHKHKDRITVGAAWDGSDYYPVEYVNILYNMIERNTTIPFDFVLNVGPLAKSNPERKKIMDKIVIVETDLPYWWCGMPFWAKDPIGVETETLLYMDLDQVIVGDLDELINFQSPHAYMKDYPSDICPKGKENDGNATVALIRNGFGHRVWDEYVKAGMPCWNPLNPPANRVFPLAAQGIMNDFGIRHDVFPESWVASYRLAVLKTGLPTDCKSVSFHGRPKPHECMNVPFVKANWK